ncbi:MAG: VOC family protein [Desulfobacteraceae bacterium]|nr:VOC family protein [Desulfobacteraceae bacterium]MBC2756871.1 VOC family protein [Desulfobacteraceae bacterium]
MTLNTIEHIGFVVKDSEGMARWYHEALGFKVLNSFETENGHVAFIKCSETGLIFELITDINLACIEEALSHPLQLHIAFKSKNIESDKDRLLKLGAEFVTDCATPDPEAKVLIVKDPWGNFIQLAQRKEDFYK